EGKIIVTNTNIEAAIQWKKNNFNFEKEDIKSIMRQIARWYGVEVAFDKNLPTETFAGQLSRLKPLDEVLKTIEGIKNIHIVYDEKNKKKIFVTTLNQFN